MYLWTYGLGKTWLDKCLKRPISDDRSTSKMVNASKYCWNLNDSTFTIFIDPREDKSGWKSHSEWYPNPQDCLLIHWLPITSILFLTGAISSNIFRCNYLGKKKYFLNFFLNFQVEFLTFPKKKMTLIADVFVNLRTRKDVVR